MSFTSPPSQSLLPVGLNLAALVLLGFAICAWFLQYTDLFPEIVSLLSLGGLFAWLAFLSNLVTDETKKALQASFEDRFLLRWKTLVGILLATLFLFLAASFWGTVLLSTRREDRERSIEILSHDSKKGWVRAEEDALPARSERKYALPTSPFGTRDYRIKISGLPARVVKVRGWRRETFRVPDSFDVPLVLVRPSGVLSQLLQSAPDGGALLVRENGTSLCEVRSYHGEAVWIGSDKDVEIPERILSRWRLSLLADQAPQEVLARWLPSVSPSPEIALAENQRIEVILILPNRLQASQTMVINPPYPREVNFDEKDFHQR